MFILFIYCAPKAFCLRQSVITVYMVRLIVFYAVFALLQKPSTTVKH
jgi:hypothetical protein